MLSMTDAVILAGELDEMSEVRIDPVECDYHGIPVRTESGFCGEVPDLRIADLLNDMLKIRHTHAVSVIRASPDVPRSRLMATLPRLELGVSRHPPGNTVPAGPVRW